jgi:hypothetical protein
VVGRWTGWWRPPDGHEVLRRTPGMRAGPWRRNATRGRAHRPGAGHPGGSRASRPRAASSSWSYPKVGSETFCGPSWVSTSASLAPRGSRELPEALPTLPAPLPAPDQSSEARRNVLPTGTGCSRRPFAHLQRIPLTRSPFQGRSSRPAASPPTDRFHDPFGPSLPHRIRFASGIGGIHAHGPLPLPRSA